jgi:DNA-binding Lrp family transcriptional regulator
MSEFALDSRDRAILDILQHDNRTPQRRIAQSVNLSAAAVPRRIKRMEAAGVIAANVAVINAVMVDHAITVFVEIEMEGERAEQIEATRRLIVTAPEVQQCHHVTGNTDFILLVVVRTMADYEALTRRLFFGNNTVKRFRSFVSMDRVKVGLTVPLGDERRT